jgi:pimeloyl-ACP methyl ester carboxylesterase
MLAALSAVAGVQPYPNDFHVQEIDANGTTPSCQGRRSRAGVVSLHGYGETGDMWEPLATALVSSHTVIVPDLRGMGLSARPAAGYDKKTQGRDVAACLRAEEPNRVTKLVLMDAPLPGVGPWDEILWSAW